MATQHKYVLLRRRYPNSKAEYYAGGGAWVEREYDAKLFNGERASVLCENLTTKHGATYAYSMRQAEERPELIDRVTFEKL